MATDRTDSSELTVEEKLQSLYELQQIDSEIDRIRILRGELPLEVQDLEDEIAGLETRISNLKQEVKDIDAEKQSRAQGIKDSESLIEKYSKQQDNVRNNREFDALSKEIEFQKLEIELCNKKIKEANAAIKGKQELESKAKAELKDCKANLEAKKSELDNIIKETESEENALVQKSNETAEKIDERLMNAYTRIRQSAINGLGVVTVDRGACGGCFNKIPPQRQLDIRLRKKIIVCEYCGRILVDKYICDYDHSLEEADKLAAAKAPKRRSKRKKA
ncbi:MAG: C4-type zinc ribbon domain-containing protein [Marinifilaceae bacterium]|jgi:predicted  nucleic acid-binding Zn-ribbon protein|nr:C4-type zinc ribbon domain-containing protein [Marinifilaceae bacterium]